VRSDLETLEYAVGAIPMEAASTGGFQLRDRYFFVARSYDTERWSAQSAGDEPTREATRRHESDGDVTERRRSGLVSVASFGWGKGWAEHELRSGGLSAAVASLGDSQIVECPDGKWRPLPPPGVRWVGNEISARVDKLRALGNAIDPHAAAQFVGAYLSAIGSSCVS
jgi:DNA (cytosine-5)-methyltransferase 1